MYMIKSMACYFQRLYLLWLNVCTSKSKKKKTKTDRYFLWLQFRFSTAIDCAQSSAALCVLSQMTVAHITQQKAVLSTVILFAV